MIEFTDAGTEHGTGRATTQEVDWQALTLALGPRVTVPWVNAEYAMYRADSGKGAVPAGVTIPRTRTAWATICMHGTVRAAHTGDAARRAGKARTQWCTEDKIGQPGCAEGAPARLPLVGHDPRETVQHTTVTQDGPAVPDAAPTTPAEPDTTTPAEPRTLTPAQKKEIARAQR